MPWNCHVLLQCAVISGAFLLNIPLGVPWYYGNLTTYTDSYFLFYGGPEAFDVKPAWLLPSFLIFAVLGYLTVDWLVGKLGIGCTQLISVLLFDLAVFLTYFSVQHSVGLMLISLMICCGYTSGINSMTCLLCASRIMPGQESLGCAIVSSSFGLGATFMNYVITAYINPDNVSPNMHEKNMDYYAQVSVLQNVPSVFLVIGIISLSIHFVGYIVEQLPLMFLKHNIDHQFLLKKNEKYYKTGHVTESNVDSVTEASFDSAIGNVPTSPTNRIIMKSPMLSEKQDDSDLKPLEIIRTRSFYQLWICSSMLVYGGLLTQMYYKFFGQLWIKDDSFLTSVGGFVAVSSAIFRLAVGFSIDKIGVKNTLVLTCAVHSVLMPFWYIAPRVHRWLYFFWSVGLTGIQGSIYILFPMCALKLYGPTYYATNSGIIMMSSVVTSLVSPMLLIYLLDNYGWFSIVLVGSVASVIVLLSVVCIMPTDRLL